MRWTSKLVLAAALVAATPAVAALEVEHARLSHGVRAWYAQSSDLPVVHVDLSFEGAGSVSDPAGREGRAAIAAAMLTEGAGELDALAFQQAMDEHAIQITASSSDDRLTIHIHTLRDHAERAGELLAMALTQPRFEEGDVARIKAEQISYLKRLREQPAYLAGRVLEETAFPDHPYASPPLGTATSVAAITADDLRDYLSTYVARGNMLVAAAGDVDGGLLRSMLDPVVERLGDGSDGPLPITRVSMQGGGESKQVASKVPQSVVLFAAPGLPRNDSRYYALYMLNEILGGGFMTSRLSDALRQEQGLVYGVDSELDLRRGAALIRGSLATRADQVDKAVAETKRILNDLRTRGVSDEECEDARSFVIGSFARQLDNTSSVAAVLLSMQIFGLGRDYLDERDAKFEAVRCSEVNRLAADLLKPERFLFVTAGSK